MERHCELAVSLAGRELATSLPRFPLHAAEERFSASLTANPRCLQVLSLNLPSNKRDCLLLIPDRLQTVSLFRNYPNAGIVETFPLC
jgi:hypothetical protein